MNCLEYAPDYSTILVGSVVNILLLDTQHSELLFVSREREHRRGKAPCRNKGSINRSLLNYAAGLGVAD